MQIHIFTATMNQIMRRLLCIHIYDFDIEELYGYNCMKNYQMMMFIFWLMKRLYRNVTNFLGQIWHQSCFEFSPFIYYLIQKTFSCELYKTSMQLSTCHLSSTRTLNTHTNNMDDRSIKQGILLRLRIAIDSKIFYAY